MWDLNAASAESNFHNTKKKAIDASELIDFICNFYNFFTKCGHRISGRRRRDAWLDFNMLLHPGILTELNRMLHNLVLLSFVIK